VNYAEAFHTLQFYVSRAVLDELTDECGAKRLETLSWPSGLVDETVGHLGMAMVKALENPERFGLLSFDHVATAINTHFAYAYGGMRGRSGLGRGGFGAWQVRRTKEILVHRLAECFELGNCADECRLSSPFQRTNSKSLRCWPLEYRIEKAKVMLVDLRLSIAEVAIASGFADENQLVNVFSEQVGTSPADWRRMSKN
jgi:AraC-like DNA-binding protein